ncbi:hypothetical protein OH77DRAFT_1519690 [Trametes cingulata]|nr:hypothetical protein OH77DRAFT_1519690 [Trametes cingulata]
MRKCPAAVNGSSSYDDDYSTRDPAAQTSTAATSPYHLPPFTRPRLPRQGFCPLQRPDWTARNELRLPLAARRTAIVSDASRPYQPSTGQSQCNRELLPNPRSTAAALHAVRNGTRPGDAESGQEECDGQDERDGQESEEAGEDARLLASRVSRFASAVVVPAAA